MRSITFVTVLTILAVASSNDVENIDIKLKCAKQCDTPPEKLMELAVGPVESSDTVKCFIKCVVTETKLINSDGTWNQDVIGQLEKDKAEKFTKCSEKDDITKPVEDRVLEMYNCVNHSV